MINKLKLFFLLFYFRPDSYPYKTMHKVIHRYYCRTIDRINESFW
ncbi:hypothetical protein AB28_4575 [Raoultella ornithinolytica 2-156-04_S1_C2]|nr:hypothetical protein AB00_5050 [Raoultella ornithinolytica 2-156-04_S1_C1]KDX10249.1 hypothetical protein AB28_4575 [Raoultella ornithinolytica 2-156-04_S1_C2]